MTISLLKNFNLESSVYFQKKVMVYILNESFIVNSREIENLKLESGIG